VITSATEPAIQVHHRAFKVKRYLKEGQRAADRDDG
jgi:hypothetical protein